MQSPLALSAELETDRLFIRKIQASDAEQVYEHYARHADLAKFLSWKPHHGAGETLSFIHNTRRKWKVGVEFTYVIFDKESGQLAGSIAAINENGRVAIGYLVTHAFHRQGIATEAVRALVAHLRSFKSIFRIWAVTHKENQPSRQVLEKAGFEYEGIVGDWTVFPNLNHAAADCHFYKYPIR